MSSLSSNAGKVNIYGHKKEQFQLWSGLANGKANSMCFKVGERFAERCCWDNKSEESREDELVWQVPKASTAEKVKILKKNRMGKKTG